MDPGPQCKQPRIGKVYFYHNHSACCDDIHSNPLKGETGNVQMLYSARFSAKKILRESESSCITLETATNKGYKIKNYRYSLNTTNFFYPTDAS